MQDEIDAIRFAAEQGDAKAQSSLGLMYDKGLGVSQDYAEAADGSGSPPSRETRGLSANSAPCIPPARAFPGTKCKAHMWPSLAAAAMKPSEHREFAVRSRDKVAAGLSVEDLALAEAAVPTETTRPESSLGKWVGIRVSIAIGVALILVTIAQL